MSGKGRRSPAAGIFAIAAFLLGGCGGHHFGFGQRGGNDGGTHAYPDNYKSEILAAMHTYLNDPTGIRDAGVSEPMLKSVASGTRYIVCLRFDGKRNDGVYAGDRQIAAEFRAGRFDNFLDATAAREPCAGATYAPFPELEQLKP